MTFGASDIALSRQMNDSTLLFAAVGLSPRCPEKASRNSAPCLRRGARRLSLTVSSPRFLARYAETFALFMHRSEQ